MFGYTLIKTSELKWNQIEVNPNMEGEYLTLGEYGICTSYFSFYKGGSWAGDNYVGEMTHWKEISNIPDGKYKESLK